jgi:uncharacterized protein involved in response to NO
MTRTAERYRAYDGPAIFSMGFRPFFLFGAIWAACALPLWIASVLGYAPHITRDWHVHEMLFGYLSAIIAGFLLTAIPNWTGRLPVSGAPLIGLFALWGVGRLITLTGESVATALVDTAFLFVLAGIVAREIVAGKNVRNLPVCGLIVVLAIANACTHAGACASTYARLGERMGIGVISMLLCLIGGRITPSFTRNWMAKQHLTTEPAPAGRFDIAVLIATGAALLSWAILDEGRAVGAGLIAAGVLNIVRLARWKGWRTVREPLVTILHVGYGWLALGLVLLGASRLAPNSIPTASGIHALTAGAFGVMTLAVMTRASRGHTGQPLAADASTTAVYALVVAGAALRVLAPFFPSQYVFLLEVSAVFWTGAFALFAIAYGPLLTRTRRITAT